MKNIKVKVFDFDGTLADSNAVKRAAWREIFTDRTEGEYLTLQKMVDAKIGDRFKILEATFREAGAKPEVIQELVKIYAEKYETLAQKLIFERGLFPGVSDLLVKFSLSPLYINSATPEEPLLKIVNTFSIDKYFKGVYGSPATKVENLEKIAALEKVSPREILMIGDGSDDLVGAEKFGARFIGIANEHNGWAKSGLKHPVISRIDELSSLLI